MPKDKAEFVNQRKSKINNDNTSQRSQRSKPSINETVKKTREASTDRSNLKKDTTTKKETLPKRTDAVNTKSKETLKPRVTPRSRYLSTPKNSLTDTKPSSTNTVKQTPKPLKAVKAASNTYDSVKRGTRTLLDTTSNRVTKQQYFPKKFPFSAHLHENEQNKNKPDTKTKTAVKENTTTATKSSKISISKSSDKEVKRLSRERTMTRVLSPSEVQVIKNLTLDNNQNLESAQTENSRPRTATIRKHTENDTDTNGQSTSSNVNNCSSNSIEMEPLNQEEDNYEDDFESYESDFEAYTSSSSSSSSTSEDTNIDTSTPTSDSSTSLKQLTSKRVNSAGNDDERKLDSGTYDLPEFKHKQLLDGIKEAVERENSDLTKRIKKSEVISNPASLSDEGFEDGSKYSLSNNGFINFTTNSKVPEKSKGKLQKRGEDLMNMIRLNSVYFNLFDMDSISYEDFMQSYGKSGTVQVSAQTGDDDVNEETQTDSIEILNKWTQYPVRFSKADRKNILQFDEQLDVGTDPPLPRKELVLEKNTSSTKKLTKFLEKSTKMILNIFEFTKVKESQNIQENDQELIFSEGYFKLDLDQTPFLKHRNVHFITFSKNSTILTVHNSGELRSSTTSEELLQRPVICIWDLREPIYPKNILVSSGDVVKACFDIQGHLIFAGIVDGSINVWDLWEPKKSYRTVHDKTTNKNVAMHPPTSNTIAYLDLEPSTTKIVAIQSFQTQYTSDELNNSNMSALQLCTLDETGILVIWSVLQNHISSETIAKDLRLGNWGYVKLIQGLTVSLQKLNPDLKELECFDLQFSETDSHHLYISSNYGVLHCLTSAIKPTPKIYTAQTDKSPVKCVEMCPFSANHFLAGCENGNIRLHSRFYEKPLITFCNINQNDRHDVKIDIIQWSNSRPCIFFVKDTMNSIYIWNLLENDTSPVHLVSLKYKVTNFTLSPQPNNSTDPYYMAIATESGEIYLHNISKEFRVHSTDQYKIELSNFLNYINRL